MRKLKLSYTQNSDFQSCQERYRLAYLCDLTQDKEKDAFRVGGAWHRCHEILEMRPESKCPDCLRHEELRSDCDLCRGTGYLPNDMMDAVARYLNRVYAEVPGSKTREDWETERVQLLYSLSGHRWYYGPEPQYQVVGSEIRCEVPVKIPDCRALRKTRFVVVVDRLVRDTQTGLLYVWERKSTSRDIADTDYWNGLTNGDQISGYVYGIRVAQQSGQLTKYGVKPSDPPVAGAICDVWHKPDIKPKVLSQKDTAEFLESGTYCGEDFRVEQVDDPASHVLIGGVQATIIPGKQGFAIRETPEMYGARLLADIAERPEHYFARREVARTDDQLEDFQQHIWNLAKQIRLVEDRNLWCRNARSCRQPFYCEFIGLCENGLKIEPGDVPPGYRKKHPQEEELEVPIV